MILPIIYKHLYVHALLVDVSAPLLQVDRTSTALNVMLLFG